MKRSLAIIISLLALSSCSGVLYLPLSPIHDTITSAIDSVRDIGKKVKNRKEEVEIEEYIPQREYEEVGG